MKSKYRVHQKTKKKDKRNNINNIITAVLNINSLVSKIDELKVTEQRIFDMLIINKKKLDVLSSYPILDKSFVSSI